MGGQLLGTHVYTLCQVGEREVVTGPYCRGEYVYLLNYRTLFAGKPIDAPILSVSSTRTESLVAGMGRGNRFASARGGDNGYDVR
jgi:hypothetical protein